MMHLLLPRIADVIKASPLFTPGNFNGLQLVEVSPEGWMWPNLKALPWPAVWIWGIGETNQWGQAVDSRETVLTVQMRILVQSVNKDVAFDEQRSAMAIANDILTLLTKNKKLKTASDARGIVTGLDLPINQKDGILTDKSTMYSIARDVQLVYKKRWGLEWSGLENDERDTF